MIKQNPVVSGRLINDRIHLSMKTQISIGNKIAKLRRQKGLSQKDLANLLGYKSASTLSKIESGENDITISTLEKIAFHLGIDMSSLLLEEKEKASPIGEDSLQEVRFKRRNKVFSFCVGGILFDGGDLLLISEGEYLTIPLSRLRIGETAPNCAKRAFKEELGLNVEIDRLLATVECDKREGEEDISTFYLFFSVKRKGRKAFIKPKGKIPMHDFYPLEKIDTLRLKPDCLKKAIKDENRNPKWVHLSLK